MNKGKDTIILNAKIVDGTGNPFYYRDIRISDDKISQIGNIHINGDEEIIDAKKMVVCPGFIDGHTHSDLSIQQNRKAESSLRQGVTTEIIGNCGIGLAPVTDKNRNTCKSMMVTYQPDVPLTWNSFKEYISELNNPGIGINIVPLVGHGVLRQAVIGENNIRAASNKEIEEMAELLGCCLDEGAAGFSTGLEYIPGNMTEKKEFLALLKVVAKKDLLHCTHIRNRDIKFKEAVDEIIELTEETGTRVLFSHLMAKPGSGKNDWNQIMQLINTKRDEGLDISTDFVPYTICPGLLYNILPEWIFDGGIKETLKKLGDKAVRKRLMTECNRYWLLFAYEEWEKVFLVSSNEHPELSNMSFQEISNKMGKHPLECVFDILIDAGEGMKDVWINGELYSEEYIREQLIHPLYGIVSDGRPTEENGYTSRFGAHPNCFGWVPKIIGNYVNDQKLISLEEAVRKMTSLPASRFNLNNRGLLTEGKIADITIFDDKLIKEEVSYEKPHKYSNSMKYVFIAGKMVVKDSQLINGMQGRVL